VWLTSKHIIIIFFINVLEFIATMMQAAQLAAEAAMQEAAAMDAVARDAAAAAAAAASRQHGGGGGYHHEQQHYKQQQHHGIPEHHQQIHHHYHPQMMMDNMEESIASLSMDSEQLGLLRALQAAEMGDHSTLQESFNMMGMDPNDASSMQSLLHLLAQQEQDISRPDEHYLTIAQNGKFVLILYRQRGGSTDIVQKSYG
jgi:hypothetical protein